MPRRTRSPGSDRRPGPRSRRDAWFRLTTLFVLDVLFIVAGIAAISGRFELLWTVVAIGAVLAIALNLVLLVRSRTTEAGNAGAGRRQVEAAASYLDLPAGVLGGSWQVLAAVGIVVNLVAVVVVA